MSKNVAGSENSVYTSEFVLGKRNTPLSMHEGINEVKMLCCTLFEGFDEQDLLSADYEEDFIHIEEPKTNHRDTEMESDICVYERQEIQQDFSNLKIVTKSPDSKDSGSISKFESI